MEEHERLQQELTRFMERWEGLQAELLQMTSDE
jgi:hypothetical protein